MDSSSRRLRKPSHLSRKESIANFKVARASEAYLDELEWRFGNRNNPWLFRDTLTKLLESEHLCISRTCRIPMKVVPLRTNIEAVCDVIGSFCE